LRSRCCSFQHSSSSSCDSFPNRGSGEFDGGVVDFLVEARSNGVTRGGFVSLDTGAAHRRARHFCRRRPVPPRLTMSTQALHVPHSFARHGAQRPHDDKRWRFGFVASAIVL
jgi:hypothetical protein